MDEFWFEFVIPNGLMRMLAEGFASRPERMTPALSVIERAIQKNFEQEGRPEPWAPLEWRYKKWKDEFFPGRKILERTGWLRDSIRVEVQFPTDPDWIVIVAWTPAAYGEVHQFGYWNEFGEVIPARPFLVLTLEDRDEFRRAIADAWGKDWRP